MSSQSNQFNSKKPKRKFSIIFRDPIENLHRKGKHPWLSLYRH